jgi:OOP family OmpA-OmpF porin
VRTKWEVGHDPCAPVPIRASLTKEDRTVYFAFNKAEILPSEQRKLDSLANFLRTDVQIQDARIVGYADRLGSAAYNKKLSEFRAKTVENYLHTHGYLNTRMAQVRWLGESAPVTRCSNTMKRKELIACLQKDRRVEVEIDYFPRTEPPPQ